MIFFSQLKTELEMKNMIWTLETNIKVVTSNS